MGWKHYEPAEPPPPQKKKKKKREPQAGRGLLGVHSLLPPPQALRFQSQAGELEARETGNEHAKDHRKEKGERKGESSFLSPPLPLLRTHHFRSERETSGNERCLKHVRDIGRKAVLSDVKTAFTCTPALNCRNWSALIG